MAKICCVIGYVKQVESKPGVYLDKPIKKKYIADLLKNTVKVQKGENLNDDINISNKVSILADSFCNANLSFMRYVEFFGAKWKIFDIEISYPRLILSIGGLYNE